MRQWRNAPAKPGRPPALLVQLALRASLPRRFSPGWRLVMAVPRLFLFSAPPRFKILFPLRIRLFSQRQARLNSPLVKFNLPCRKKKAGDNSKGENSIMLKNPDYYPTPEAVAAKILSCTSGSF